MGLSGSDAVGSGVCSVQNKTIAKGDHFGRVNSDEKKSNCKQYLFLFIYAIIGTLLLGVFGGAGIGVGMLIGD